LRILIDECVPRALKRHLQAHDVLTVAEAGFAGLKNGQLLRRAEGNFDAVITTDKSLQHQQNLSVWTMAFVLLRAVSNDIADLEPLIPELLRRLPEVTPGTLTVIA
jgi:predicted nuclease of predicted toxin-antitoxin system